MDKTKNFSFSSTKPFSVDFPEFSTGFSGKFTKLDDVSSGSLFFLHFWAVFCPFLASLPLFLGFFSCYCWQKAHKLYREGFWGRKMECRWFSNDHTWGTTHQTSQTLYKTVGKLVGLLGISTWVLEIWDSSGVLPFRSLYIRFQETFLMVERH